jgi:hypothetical protein
MERIEQLGPPAIMGDVLSPLGLPLHKKTLVWRTPARIVPILSASAILISPGGGLSCPDFERGRTRRPGMRTDGSRAWIHRCSPEMEPAVWRPGVRIAMVYSTSQRGFAAALPVRDGVSPYPV